MSGLASWTPHSELFLGGSHWEVTEWIDYTSWLLGRDGGVGEGESKDSSLFEIIQGFLEHKV